MAVSTIRRSSPPRNQLLAALSARDFALLQPPLRSTELALKKDIERPNRRIDFVCFIDFGIAWSSPNPRERGSRLASSGTRA